MGREFGASTLRTVPLALLHGVAAEWRIAKSKSKYKHIHILFISLYKWTHKVYMIVQVTSRKWKEEKVKSRDKDFIIMEVQ